MRWVAALVVIAACGGGGRESAVTSPGPVLHPEVDRDPPVGALVRDDSTAVRAAMVSSIPTLPAPTDGDDLIYSSRGPSMFDEPLPAVTGRPPPTGCDPEPEMAKGKEALAVGSDAVALKAFERALSCVGDPKIEQLATLVACRAKIFSRARYHFVRLPPAMQTQMAQICRPPSFVDL